MLVHDNSLLMEYLFNYKVIITQTYIFKVKEFSRLPLVGYHSGGRSRCVIVYLPSLQFLQQNICTTLKFYTLYTVIYSRTEKIKIKTLCSDRCLKVWFLLTFGFVFALLLELVGASVESVKRPVGAGAVGAGAVGPGTLSLSLLIPITV